MGTLIGTPPKALAMAIVSSGLAGWIAAGLATAASCAFMLSAAMPPQAIVLASGHMTVGSTIRAGRILDLMPVVPVIVAVKKVAVLSGAR